MAESREFQVGNKAKDLLIYSISVTKPVSDKSMETKDVLSTMLRLKEMNPEEVKAFWETAADRIRRRADKQGYPKSAVHSYIKIIREPAGQRNALRIVPAKGRHAFIFPAQEGRGRGESPRSGTADAAKE